MNEYYSVDKTLKTGEDSFNGRIQKGRGYSVMMTKIIYIMIKETNAINFQVRACGQNEPRRGMDVIFSHVFLEVASSSSAVLVYFAFTFSNLVQYHSLIEECRE